METNRINKRFCRVVTQEIWERDGNFFKPIGEKKVTRHELCTVHYPLKKFDGRFKCRWFDWQDNQTLLKQLRAVKLREEGETYACIGDVLGCSRSYAQVLYRRGTRYIEREEASARFRR